MHFYRRIHALYTRTISSIVYLVSVVTLLSWFNVVSAQPLQRNQSSANPTINAIADEAMNNSQLELLAHELLDVIGPRLVGSPQMQQAHEWAVEKYTSWGIDARNEKWGEWKAWERGITHIDLISPRIRTLEGMQLAWSPSTGKKAVTGEVVLIPDVSDSIAFQKWLPQVKGKFVLFSASQPTGRPDDNWETFGTKASMESMKEKRDELSKDWNNRIRRTGYTYRDLQTVMERAGAVGIITSTWSKGFGTNKIFGAYTHRVPTIDLSLEDYGLLYRLADYGKKPQIRVIAESKDLGTAPTFNTIAEIKGTEKPDEYVMLSAHLDSWDGAAGATDNGTGVITMMEVARILKKLYPNPKRTILVGLWGSEEQGLNGSRAFVEDHPEIVDHIQVVFNQDNGTGRVAYLSGQGFLHAYDFLGRWLSNVPAEITEDIKTEFPGLPGAGGSDHVSFIAVGVPAFFLSSLNWSYGNYTWHTNRDTYDKIVFDDVKSNVILTAVLTYMASEDPQTTSRERMALPIRQSTGQKVTWPVQKSPIRDGRK